MMGSWRSWRYLNFARRSCSVAAFDLNNCLHLFCWCAHYLIEFIAVSRFLSKQISECLMRVVSTDLNLRAPSDAPYGWQHLCLKALRRHPTFSSMSRSLEEPCCSLVGSDGCFGFTSCCTPKRAPFFRLWHASRKFLKARCCAQHTGCGDHLRTAYCSGRCVLVGLLCSCASFPGTACSCWPIRSCTRCLTCFSPGGHYR